MNRFGKNLYQFFEQCGNYLSRVSVYSLGINLIDILEKIHNAGFVYNDLKPENIMLGSYERQEDYFT